MQADENKIPEFQSVEVIENTWIEVRDGTRLAAKMWLPKDARRKPVPAILEYIPYRKRDFKAVRDSQIHAYFAAHGYAAVRVDLRGSGDSEGVLLDEYLQQELNDGLDILQWIAKQDWCTGRIGMFGISWGGFNGLQIAALQPPELQAVITVCSTDDRYADDVHYMGGCMLTDNLSWASTMFAYNSCPPDPQLLGDRWREMWLSRLEESGLWLEKWLRHQRRDGYWKHGSICEDYSAIQCPVFAVSGWADGYSDAVFRLMENLSVPRKGLIGAWGHKYPHMGGPGPAIGFLQESLRWWDKWLKDIDNGVDEDPIIRIWMRDSFQPLTAIHSGRWVAEEECPSPRIIPAEFSLTAIGLRLEDPISIPGDNPGEIKEQNLFETETEARGMGTSTPEENIFEVQSPLSVGLYGGKWTSYAETTDLPNDQRESDGGALVFDTLPLSRPLEILGAPEVQLRLSSDKPLAQIAVRLSIVIPDGTVSRVTYGLLNLAHRNSHEKPSPLEPGKPYTVKIPLNYVAQKFSRGDRIRVAITNCYWPLAWPSPEETRLKIYTTDSRLTLPVRPLRAEDEELPAFEPPETAPPVKTTILAPERREWTLVHNLASNEVSQNIINDSGRYRLDDIDLTIQSDSREHFIYTNNNYKTLRAQVHSARTFTQGDWWNVRTVTDTILTSTKTHFQIRATLDAFDGDVRIFSKSWDKKIPRDHM